MAASADQPGTAIRTSHPSMTSDERALPDRPGIAHRSQGWGGRVPSRIASAGDDLSVEGDDRLHPRALHDDHRRHDGQRRAAEDGGGLRRPHHRHRVGVGRLPPHLRRRDSRRRLARRPFRHQACLRHGADRLRGHLAAVRRRADPRSADRLPPPPGPRCWTRHADRRCHALPRVPDGGAGARRRSAC